MTMAIAASGAKTTTTAVRTETGPSIRRAGTTAVAASSAAPKARAATCAHDTKSDRELTKVAGMARKTSVDRASTVRASGWHRGGSLGAITQWAIVAFTVIAALSQLQIATAFLQDLFRAIVAMLAIAGGLAFGLGGKDHAKKVLDKLEDSFQ